MVDCHYDLQSEFREKVRVLILGSYVSKGIEQVSEVRKELQERHFLNTRIMTDFHRPIFSGRLANEKISKYWIDRSDIHVIFLMNRDNSGVHVEFDHLVQTYRLQTTLVAYRKKDRKKSLDCFSIKLRQVVSELLLAVVSKQY